MQALFRSYLCPTVRFAIISIPCFQFILFTLEQLWNTMIYFPCNQSDPIRSHISRKPYFRFSTGLFSWFFCFPRNHPGLMRSPHLTSSSWSCFELPSNCNLRKSKSQDLLQNSNTTPHLFAALGVFKYEQDWCQMSRQNLIWCSKFFVSVFFLTFWGEWVSELEESSRCLPSRSNGGQWNEKWICRCYIYQKFLSDGLRFY